MIVPFAVLPVKSTFSSSLVATITAVVDGEEVIAPEIRRQLDIGSPLSDLTTRQREILQSMVRGLYDKDIAALRRHLLKL